MINKFSYSVCVVPRLREFVTRWLNLYNAHNIMKIHITRSSGQRKAAKTCIVLGDLSHPFSKTKKNLRSTLVKRIFISSKHTKRIILCDQRVCLTMFILLPLIFYSAIFMRWEREAIFQTHFYYVYGFNIFFVRRSL